MSQKWWINYLQSCSSGYLQRKTCPSLQAAAPPVNSTPILAFKSDCHEIGLNWIASLIATVLTMIFRINILPRPSESRWRPSMIRIFFSYKHSPSITHLMISDLRLDLSTAVETNVRKCVNVDTVSQEGNSFLVLVQIYTDRYLTATKASGMAIYALNFCILSVSEEARRTLVVTRDTIVPYLP